MKKILCLMLAIFMVAGLMSGCKEGGNVSSVYDPSVEVKDSGGLKLPISEDGEKITWSVTSAVTNHNDTFFAQTLRKMTGVNVQFDTYPISTAMEKIKILAASKNLPDIIGQGLDTTMADDLCMQGAFAAVEDYIDVLPNFKRVFVDDESKNWVFKSYCAPDGKLYGYYGWGPTREINTNATMYRKDIFDKHGLKMWNNPDEFYAVAKKLKELYPDSVPYTTKSGDAIFKALGVSWGFEAYQPYYDEDQRKWLYADIQPEFKDMLDFVKKCYDEGLIDPEFLTNTQSAWTTKMTQPAKAFVTTDWIGRMEMFKEQTAQTVPDYDLRYANPIGPVQVMREPNRLSWARYVSKNERAETAFKLLDFCLSPTGTELFTMGVEGETYTLNEKGMAVYKGFEDKVPTLNDIEETYGLMIEGVYLSQDTRSYAFNYTEREQEAQDWAKEPGRLTPIDPILQFTAEEKEIINPIKADLDRAGREFAAKYVLGTESGEEAWKNWVEKANKLGAAKMIEIYDAAQARYEAK